MGNPVFESDGGTVAALPVEKRVDMNADGCCDLSVSPTSAVNGFQEALKIFHTPIVSNVGVQWLHSRLYIKRIMHDAVYILEVARALVGYPTDIECAE